MALPHAPGFVSEPITPLDASFDTRLMAQGQPGLPHKFRWRQREFALAQILEQWKEHGDCKHGSGERYVRKHVFRILTTDGVEMTVYFQRTFGRGRKIVTRWWLLRIDRAEPRRFG